MWRKWLGGVLLAAGILTLCFPMLQKNLYDREQQELIAAFEQLGKMDDLLLTDDQLIATASTEPVKDQQSSLQGARGLMKIEKIKMEMLIFEGVSESELLRGAGMIEPQKKFDMNNIGIAGHRAVAEGKLFNRLGDLAVGDDIQVETKEQTLHYRVISTFVVHESEVSVLDDKEEPLLTLVTCTPLGKRNPPDRLIVQAELQKVEKH